MKNIFYIFGIALTLMSTNCSENKETVQEISHQETSKVKMVRTTPVTAQSITSKITTNGRIKQADDYDLSFPINGTIAGIWIAKGKRVTAGQQIATIQEVTVENRISQSQLNTQQTQNNINRLRSQLKVSNDNLKENEKLHRERIITGDQLNSSRLETEALQSQLKNAMIQLDIVRRELGILDEQRNLHVLVAPVSGIITEKMVQSGEQVAAGQPIGILQPGTKEHVFLCTVSDREIIQLYIGSRATITLDAYPDDAFQGRVSYISQETSTTGTYEVEITLDKSQNRLLPGMFGNVAISNSQSHQYLAVPINTLVWANGKNGKVMIEDGLHAETRLIKIHEIQGDQVLITDGLLATDNVILNANGLITQGDSIAIVQQ